MEKPTELEMAAAVYHLHWRARRAQADLPYRADRWREQRVRGMFAQAYRAEETAAGLGHCRVVRPGNVSWNTPGTHRYANVCDPVAGDRLEAVLDWLGKPGGRRMAAAGRAASPGAAARETGVPGPRA